jgi:RNA polymerase sigma-70 factor (ECF subfamily)
VGDEGAMNNTPNTRILPSDAADDHALVMASKRGDAQAFELLVKRHQPKIFALAMRYTGVREDAEDVVQEALHKAFIHLRKFQGKSSFFTWLTRIAINEALMLLRKGRSLREVSMNDPGEGKAPVRHLEIPEPGLDPEANYLKHEAAELLRAAVGKLTARLRTTIELRELSELSTQETARRLGLSVDAVKSRVFQGRRTLHKTLRRVGVVPKRVQRLPIAA